MSKTPRRASRHNRRSATAIHRRDFLHGSLLAAGGVAVGGLSPRAVLASPPSPLIDGPVGELPASLHGGNLRRCFRIGHWLRDRRIDWTPNSVVVAASPLDDFEGSFPLRDDGGDYNLIIVGGGISGLATAFFAGQMHPQANILILENNPRVGGNASRDSDAPLSTPASAAGAYLAYPYADFLDDFYTGIGIDVDAHLLASPVYSYFFDAGVGPNTTTSLMPAGTKRWVADAYSKAGIDDMPFPWNVRKQFKTARQRFRQWYNAPGAPTDPPEDSDPRFDYLSFMSLREYLENEEGFDPVIADFYDQYASDSLGGLADQVNAHSAISFLGAEYRDLVSAPGGLSFVARRAVKHLIPNAIDGDSDQDILFNPIKTGQLDLAGNRVRYRTSCTALRLRDRPNKAKLRYYHADEDAFYKTSAKAVVLAGQMFSGRALVERQASEAQSTAAGAYRHLPTPVANVVVNNSRFLVDAGVGYNFYWYGNGTRIWQDAVVGDWATVGGTAAATDGSRPNVLTVYSGGFGPYENATQDRLALLGEPFSTYENALREDLGRVFAATGFDFDRDVDAIHLYRWGHSLVAVPPGWLFGPPDGGSEHVAGDRNVARQAIGRISFAAQDSEGNPAIENAIFAGRRAAQEVSQFL